MVTPGATSAKPSVRASMTLFMEVEPPVATVPDRLLRSLVASAAEDATEEAVEEAEEAVLAAVELEELPPQAARAPAAAAAPQTARKERRLIFFIMYFLQNHESWDRCLFDR